MELSEVFTKRKSIRSYKNNKVQKEDIIKLIECAQYAPSWKNSQTTHYHVVQSDKMVNRLKEECLSPSNAQRTMNVTTYIIVSFEKNISGFNEDGTPSNEGGNGWGYYDAGLATDNLILKATELGLGTLIMGIRDASKIREVLDIPESQIITAVIGVGYAEVTPDRNPRKEIEKIVKFY